MTTATAVINSFLRNQKTFMNYLQKVNEGKLHQNNSSINCADIVKICTKHCLHCVAVLCFNQNLNEVMNMLPFLSFKNHPYISQYKTATL